MGRLIIKALADLHGYLPPAKVVGRCDVLCICGDICPLDYQHNDTKCVSWFCLDFVPWTKSLDCDKVIFIAGNHDIWIYNLYKEKKRTPSRILKCLLVGNHKAENKIVYLQDNSYNYKGVRFYGTPWIPKLKNWGFYLKDEEIIEKYNNIPKKVDVLLTHSPITLNNTGVVLQDMKRRFMDFGSEELSKAINSRDIKYALCGHVHSGEHSPATINGTTIVNVSIKDEDYKPTYDIFEFEI